MTDPRVFVALKAFIERDGNILILREAGTYIDGTQTGKYDVPGGRLLPGENFAEGFKREVREETGLDIEFGTPFHMGEWRPAPHGEQWHIVATFVRCQSHVGDVVCGPDHDAFEWIDPSAFDLYPIASNLRDAFRAYGKLKN